MEHLALPPFYARQQAPNMPNTQKTFKQGDLQRAIRAARACDLPILRSEITNDGRIVLVHFDTTTPSAIPANDDAPANEWDKYFNAARKE